jgi:hypothetical protein
MLCPDPRQCLAAVCLGMLLGGGACGAAPQGAEEQPRAEFRDPRRVAISGYDGDAMEPFISCDGNYLFFNNRNEPSAQTDVHFAAKAGDDGFSYLGPVSGVNQPSPVLDAVPSLDAAGTFFFISTRSYETTLSTLYAGAFREGQVTAVRLVEGDFARRQPGWLTMDAEVSRDGSLLYYADARFAGGAAPEEADLGVARRVGDAFNVAADSKAQLANVNSGALEYAPSTSADGLEIFFTRLTGSQPVILHAVRTAASVPFGAPQSVSAITGFAEAPSLSCDGRSLYYHREDGGKFSIYRVTRTP